MNELNTLAVLQITSHVLADEQKEIAQLVAHLQVRQLLLEQVEVGDLEVVALADARPGDSLSEGPDPRKLLLTQLLTVSQSDQVVQLLLRWAVESEAEDLGESSE